MSHPGDKVLAIFDNGAWPAEGSYGVIVAGRDIPEKSRR
jgi:hypothetical protein